MRETGFDGERNGRFARGHKNAFGLGQSHTDTYTVLGGTLSLSLSLYIYMYPPHTHITYILRCCPSPYHWPMIIGCFKSFQLLKLQVQRLLGIQCNFNKM